MSLLLSRAAAAARGGAPKQPPPVSGADFAPWQLVLQQTKTTWAGSRWAAVGYVSGSHTGVGLAKQAWQQHSSRGFHSSHVASALPALVPVAAAYALAKVWIFKPAGALLKSLTVGNIVRAARTGSMIRCL